MKNHHRKMASQNKSLLLFGVASLLWFIFRTGTKPSRIVYPCQRAALANSSLLLSISIPLSITIVLTKTKKFLSKRGIPLALLIILASTVMSSEQFLGSLQLAGAVNPDQEIELTLEPRNATAFPASDIYAVNGRRASAPHISELINLMGSHGLFFYKSCTSRVNQGSDGLIAHDDVVLIKINEQWPCRGGTNTDILKELIQAIVSHPDGFVGEIVVADNGQGWGSMDWPQSNAENITQSTQDVVNMFSPSYNVSTYDWQPIRGTQVDEYSEGDMTDGYILYDTADPETGIYASYPKFKTEFGTYISFKHGIWNGTGYEKRLKVVNMPVLKSHRVYGVTGSLKHYMGVQSEMMQGGLANGHSTVGTGGMGTLMVETGLPTLNIIDAISINANPPPSFLTGPETYYNRATRVNVLMASTDPVALDYWAAKYVLVQAASLIGYDDTHTLDPNNTDRSGVSGQAFGIWLGLTKNELAAGGYNVTTSEDRMNVYVYSYPDTTAPNIYILSPENKTYLVNNIPLTFTVSESTSWIGYCLDGQSNVTIAGNTILTGLSHGAHSVTVYANDIAGNMGSSDTIFFTIGYALTIHSMPTEVTFTVNGVSRTTPWSGTYSEGASVSLEMPETHTVGEASYYWNQWGDGNTSRSRTVVMNTNITLTANYTGPYYELTVTSSPVVGVTFTINGTPETTPYIGWLLEGSYSLAMPAIYDGFAWFHWLEDGDTNRTKTITLSRRTTWTGVFALLGDLNYDGTVDMADLDLLIEYFATSYYYTPERWCPNCDLNKDNFVDMADIIVIITNFGKTI